MLANEAKHWDSIWMKGIYSAVVRALDYFNVLIYLPRQSYKYWSTKGRQLGEHQPTSCRIRKYLSNARTADFCCS